VENTEVRPLPLEFTALKPGKAHLLKNSSYKMYRQLYRYIIV